MRILTAMALAAALATMAGWSNAEAAEARIVKFAFGCETPDGEKLKPKFGDIDEAFYTDLPAQRQQCFDAVQWKIWLCRENTGFESNTKNEKYAGCLPVFEAQAEVCVAHFERERLKCYAGAPWLAEAVPEAPYTINHIDWLMELEVVERANVRAGPATDYAVVGTLDAGVRVQPTGSVDGRDWWQVRLPGDGGTGFIFAPLLREPEIFGPWWLVADNQDCRVHKPGTRPGETVTWSGACLDGKASGEGRAVWHHGGGTEIYDGAMQSGRRHGSGTLVAATGDRYEGEWRDGWKHGRGTSTWADGDRYEGEYRDGSPRGYGTYTWADGARYEGEYRDGFPHGYGTYTNADGRVDEGQWRGGCFGERGGRWVTLHKSAEACGFE